MASVALAVAAGALYMAVIVPHAPHIEAWRLHAGCVMVVAVLAWIAVRQPSALSLRAILGVIVSLCLVSVGTVELRRTERTLAFEAARLEEERTGMPRIPLLDPPIQPIFQLPPLQQLVSTAEMRGRGWVRASVWGLWRMDDRDAAGSDLFEPLPAMAAPPEVSILGPDRIGPWKRRVAAERELLRRAEGARARLLALASSDRRPPRTLCLPSR